MTTNKHIREVTIDDKVRIYKPRLLMKKTVFGDLLVRMHEDDNKYIPRLYEFLAIHGDDVREKKDEFACMRWLIVPRHRIPDLKRHFRLIKVEG